MELYHFHGVMIGTWVWGYLLITKNGLGQMLNAEGNGGKYAPPEEARAALNKYLELSPFGEHAQLVREMIDKLNEYMDTPAKPAKTVKK